MNGQITIPVWVLIACTIGPVGATIVILCYFLWRMGKEEDKGNKKEEKK